MPRFAQRLWGSTFIRGIATVATGTAGAQALTVLATPILTRLFTPEHIGVLGTFTAIVGVVGVVAALRLDLAIVVPREEEAAVAVTVSAIGVVGIVTLLTAIAAALAVLIVPGVAATPGAAVMAGLLPLAVAITGTFRVMTQWLARSGHFRTMAEAHVVQSATTVALQLIGGVVAASVGVLVLGKVLGQASAAVRAAAGSLRYQPALGRHRSGFRAIWRTVGTHRAFTVFGSSQALVNAVNQGLPVFLLTAFFGPAVVGFYVLANRVLGLPFQLIGQSIRQVIYPKLSRDLAAGTGLQTTRRTTLGLAAMTLPVIVLVMWFGEPAFALILGREWAVAGVFAGYTVLWLGSAFMNIPSVSAIPLLGLQRAHLVFEIAYLAGRALALWLAASYGDARLGVAAVSVVGALFNLLLIVFVDRAMARHRPPPATPERVASQAST